jgi:hypothetical protein
MVRRSMSVGMAAGVMSLLATGCGGDKKDSKGSSDAESRTACKAPAASKPTGLPAAFPIPGELTISQVRKDGPTNVVDGYWTSGLDEAYTEFKDQVGQAGYKVLFTEKDAHDAEISYKGSGRTGQIALRDNCTESNTTRVHITNRPA